MFNHLVRRNFTDARNSEAASSFRSMVEPFSLGLRGLVLLAWPVFGLGAGLVGPGLSVILGGILTASAMVFFICWWIASLFTTLTVTNKRCTYQEGIIARDTSEVQHDDVRNLQIDQGIAQRLLRVGDIAISSSGQDDMEIRAAGIPGPERVAEVIREYQ